MSLMNDQGAADSILAVFWVPSLRPALFLCLSSSDLFWMAQNLSRQRQKKKTDHQHHLGNHSAHIWLL